MDDNKLGYYLTLTSVLHRLAHRIQPTTARHPPTIISMK
jgi:hypothetical protein